MLVSSEEAYKSEIKTFEKNLAKQEELLKKKLWHLSNQEFETEKSAKRAFKAIKEKFFTLEAAYEQIPKYEGKGRPSAKAIPIDNAWKIKSNFSRNEKRIKESLNTKGRFILATNDLEYSLEIEKSILTEYKDQQSVERGFRFFKDPWFMLDKIFLKSPKRISALCMVMTLCLLVYNFAQYKLRSQLEEKQETIPNQVGKQISKPTMRWVFQMFSGVSIVRIWDQTHQKSLEFISNLDKWKRKIISCFGFVTREIYGIP